MNLSLNDSRKSTSAFRARYSTENCMDGNWCNFLRSLATFIREFPIKIVIFPTDLPKSKRAVEPKIGEGLPPKSSILIGFSNIFTIHLGVPLIFGNIHVSLKKAKVKPWTLCIEAHRPRDKVPIFMPCCWKNLSKARAVRPRDGAKGPIDVLLADRTCNMEHHLPYSSHGNTESEDISCGAPSASCRLVDPTRSSRFFEQIRNFQSIFSRKVLLSYNFVSYWLPWC